MAVSNRINGRMGLQPRPPGGPTPRRQLGLRLAAALLAFTGVLVALVGPVSAAPTATSDRYVVQRGDSLSVIARDHGVSTQDLAAANGISNLHLIRVGQVLTIPRLVHVVQRGESLSVIAARAGVSLSSLVQLNGISNPNLIRIGQELRLPSGAKATGPVDPAAGYDSLPQRLRDNPERLRHIPSFERWAAHYGVPADLLMAVAYRESGWQTDVVSPKGAIGVGQLMPTTATWVADHLIGEDLDPWVADDNIRISARFLDWLIGYMGSEEAAMAGYYQGPGSVRALGYYDDTQAYLTNVAQIRHMFTRS